MIKTMTDQMENLEIKEVVPFFIIIHIQVLAVRVLALMVAMVEVEKPLMVQVMRDLIMVVVLVVGSLKEHNL